MELFRCLAAENLVACRTIVHFRLGVDTCVFAEEFPTSGT